MAVSISAASQDFPGDQGKGIGHAGEGGKASPVLPTPELKNLLDALVEALSAEPAVRAAWLAGGLGRGEADAFSDIDLLILADERGASEAAAACERVAAKIGEPVVVNRLFGGRVLNFTTAAWQRFDFVIAEPADLVRYDRRALAPLFNRTDHEPPEQDIAFPSPPLRPMIEEFLRILGLSVVGLGRGEWIASQRGFGLLRDLIIAVMEEAGRDAGAAPGGALSLNRRLTADQRAALEALPNPAADHAALLAANLAAARLFLPLARDLARRRGVDWPEALEAATRAHLKARLDVELEA
jgi:predicted nucleotidyltransferase